MTAGTNRRYRQREQSVVMAVTFTIALKECVTCDYREDRYKTLHRNKTKKKFLLWRIDGSSTYNLTRKRYKTPLGIQIIIRMLCRNRGRDDPSLPLSLS